MNKKVRKMMRRIERRGGTVVIPESLPDELVERFLQEVLACPDCCAASDIQISETQVVGTMPHGRALDSAAVQGRRNER
jgi:hypothetical protein